MIGCRQYGFFSYMKDLFQCPDSVMAYLCVLYNVHRIPVGDEGARRHVEEVIRSHPEVRQFYTANVQVSTHFHQVGVGVDACVCAWTCWKDTLCNFFIFFIIIFFKATLCIFCFCFVLFKAILFCELCVYSKNLSDIYIYIYIYAFEALVMEKTQILCNI